MRNTFKDGVVLVTGGTGTVGREIVSAMLKFDPRVVRVFSRDESKQFDMAKEYRGEKRLRFFVGDVRDKERLTHAMDGVDYIFHTAAMKHVIACEYNPFEALKTNLLGTKNVIESSIECGAKKMMLTSSDKATNPCNTMGVSKLFAERLVTAANYYKGTSRTVLSSVRFGNIVGSRGSVIPALRKQIESGGPVTITDKDMTRFIITRAQALEFVLKSTLLAKGGEIFIPKMKALRVGDLVDVMIQTYARKGSKSKIKLEKIGRQPGEKTYEELMTDEEVTRAVETDDMFILIPDIPELYERKYKYPGARPPQVQRYISQDYPPMTREEICSLLKEIGMCDYL
ncbi:MAG TPA: SDR family NAD(P)-dependent oxidoreductase [bacterium]|nr:SDR family NAD(P)-dependent oxidoreductase [bacterium]